LWQEFDIFHACQDFRFAPTRSLIPDTYLTTQPLSLSSQTVIKVENLSKQYRLGEIGTGTLSKDLNRWWARVRGKEDPYLKIGEVNDRSTRGNSDFVWALKDINFEVEQGEVLGIIGKNGAGKSTLLKILSKVTGPTTGHVKAKGRIASLLEVGTGFHPELTGRENIYLNGTILGMTRREVTRKLDEIVDFAGVARYLDTPVKRYSSGMKVRLGFAVAAHLEPDILIVDEVLAVGDAEFQKKAIGKMQEVSSEGGRTVLFVSHNMASVRALCNKGVLLKDGGLDLMGEVNRVVDQYQDQSEKMHRAGPLDVSHYRRPGNAGRAVIEEIIVNGEFKKSPSIEIGENIWIQIKVRSELDLKRATVGFTLKGKYETPLTTNFSTDKDSYFDLKRGLNVIELNIKSLLLLPGEYFMDIWIHEIIGSRAMDYIVDFPVWKILEGNSHPSILRGKRKGDFVISEIEWQLGT
jgi:lipopolysaccharide transport system ATP-binding protein